MKVVLVGFLLCSISLCLWVSVVQASPPPPTRLTHDGLLKGRPAWAPDGKHVALARHEGNRVVLYVFAADGSQPRRLLNQPQPVYDPAWSLDGKSLLVTMARIAGTQGYMEIQRVPLDGSPSVPIVRSGDKPSHAEAPCWAPAGKRIAFSSTRDGNQEIYAADADGGRVTRLTQHPGTDAHPAWSPDGRRIAFATDRWLGLDVAVMDADGSHVVRLTSAPGLDDYPAWSPDGRRIAFVSARDGPLNIFVMNADGTHQVNVSHGPSVDTYPAWTPDGRLSFISNRDGEFDLYILPARGLESSGGKP